MTIGEKIYKLRTEAKISQETLALDLNISRQAVSKWETDQSIPDLDNIKMIANYFNVTVESLVDEDYEKLINKEDLAKNTNTIKMVGKILMLSTLGLIATYFTLFLVFTLFQIPLGQLIFDRHNIFIFSFPLFLIVLSNTAYYIVMSIISLKRLGQENKKNFFEMMALISIALLITARFTFGLFNSSTFSHRDDVEYLISYSNYNALINSLSILITTIDFIYVAGASLILAGKVIDKSSYKPFLSTKTYKKWHSVVTFFASYNFGIILLPFYISFMKEHKNQTLYKTDRISHWYKLGLILNLIYYSIIILILFIMLLINL